MNVKILCGHLDHLGNEELLEVWQAVRAVRQKRLKEKLRVLDSEKE